MWVSSTICSLPHGKKMALGHTGQQSISHLERTKERAIRTVHRKHLGKLHCSLSHVFPQKNAPWQQLLCQPAFLPSAKYKPAELTAVGKAETCRRNRPVQPAPRISPGIQGMDAAGSGPDPDSPVRTFWMASK